LFSNLLENVELFFCTNPSRSQYKKFHKW